MTQKQSNFLHLSKIDEGLAQLGLVAERYFADDSNTSLLKLRQFGERMAQRVAAQTGLYQSEEESQATLLGRLKAAGYLPREAADLFHWIRKAGNEANHQFQGDHRGALQALKFAHQLGVWFHRSFNDAHFRGGAFIPPVSPANESATLHAELQVLLSSN
jgi:type I restriction enzyme R subunit